MALSAVAGDVGKEHPESQEVIDFLTAAFREQAASGAIRASGVCIDVRTIPPGQTEKTDAILARLEHKDGEAIDVTFPTESLFLERSSTVNSSPRLALRRSFQAVPSNPRLQRTRMCAPLSRKPLGAPATITSP